MVDVHTGRLIVSGPLFHDPSVMNPAGGTWVATRATCARPNHQNAPSRFRQAIHSRRGGGVSPALRARAGRPSPVQVFEATRGDPGTVRDRGYIHSLTCRTRFRCTRRLAKQQPLRRAASVALAPSAGLSVRSDSCRGVRRTADLCLVCDESGANPARHRGFASVASIARSSSPNPQQQVDPVRRIRS